VLEELGAIGLCVFLWLLASVHNVTRTAMNADDLPPRLQGMARGFYAGFWGVVTHALTANSFIIVRIAEPFWFITGLIMVSLILRDQRMEENAALLPQTSVIKIPEQTPC